MIRQGDIIELRINPKKELESKVFRPCICLSHSIITKYTNTVIVAPISDTDVDYPFYISLKDTNTTGKVLVDQLFTIELSSRDYRYLESVSDELLSNLLAHARVLFEREE